jgi:serine/threonine-protein kinase HipA
MIAAKRSGLNVAIVDLIEYTNHENIETEALIVERYDRELVDNILSRLHQEDACQALGFSPIKKYEYNQDHEDLKHGPGYKELTSIINQFSSVPAIDKIELLNRIFFNLIIGNNDFHGKNTSFIHMGDNLVRLSPAYDIVCTEAYDEVDHDDAMRIGAAKNIREATKDDLQLFFNQLGVKRKRMMSYCDKALMEINRVAEMVKA